MDSPSKCPNCNKSFEKEGLASLAHVESGCALAALIGVVIERESCPVPSDQAIEEIDTDWFWNRLGPVIDKLEHHLQELSEE